MRCRYENALIFSYRFDRVQLDVRITAPAAQLFVAGISGTVMQIIAREQGVMKRCKWAGSDPLMVKYHDEEWGVPVNDDHILYEMLTLGGAQAGLSWSTILKRRKHYRDAFARFDPWKVARFTQKKRDQLVQNAGIIRNKLKIESAINNAKAVLAVQREFGSLADFIWTFVDHRPIQNRWKSVKEIPTETVESQAMSKELKERGFTFVGPTICYAFMQAVGMVNDHEAGCFRYRQVLK